MRLPRPSALRRRSCLAGAVVCAVLAAWLPVRAAEVPRAAAAVDFDREVRPILSENCFQCHGPDEKVRKAKLRLDTKEGAFGKRGVIIPHEPVRSALIERVASTDDETRMPPPKTGKRLTPEQVAKLRLWIEQGATWSQHWAFVTPKHPALPAVRDTVWVRNPIDRFILARLEREGLKPSPEADRTTLIRRVTLDLTGLPPTPQEVDAFLADSSPRAYEHLVDRLLASPRYGERMALEWLDAARFADTHGYHIDSGRDMTRWREWVIDAFNSNLPFDRFTIEQLAGDLLPGATLSQKIASGFNRNHMINFEGGAIPEEYHAAYIVDRINTTSAVWLGLTLNCCQCHDHKYDPFTQKEFYQLYAFFHNVPENGLDGSKGNAAPLLKTPTSHQRARLDQLAAAIREVESHRDDPSPSLDRAQAAWEKQAAVKPPSPAWSPLDPFELRSRGAATLTRLDDRSIFASDTNPTSDTYTISARTGLGTVSAVRIEALPDDRLPAKGPGRSSNGNIVLTDVRVFSGGKALKVRSASADFSQKDYPVAYAIDKHPETGWAIFPEVGKPHFAVFELEKPIRGDKEIEMRVVLDFRSPFGQHQLGRFRLSVTDSPSPHGEQALPAAVAQALAVPAQKRSEAQKAELRRYFRTQVSTEGKEMQARLTSLREEMAELERQVPTTMVMQEMASPRETYLLIRGQYDRKGEKVRAATPAQLPPLSSDAPPNRLGLARWLVSPEQPLTARVIVNRYWQMYFGTGLVKTAEDFGTQGERPSHPELLDWLATEFVGTGWDVKAMQRLIVTSTAYRQSARVTPDLLARDPENRLLARASRLRLPAEFIRDQALAISGLLNGEIGGKSVSPYQPPGIWEELAYRADFKNWTAQVYVQDHGKDLYRRGMYTFWKRTAPPPTLVTFDAPDRETCTVRRARTNTPLQALILMNDPTYVEAARKLAERVMTECGTTPEERIAYAFLLATARRPSAAETAVLRRVYDGQLAAYRKDAAAARKLLSVGESPRRDNLDVAELAAWTAVASVILNLDETVTRG
jgi:hypothetical protein